MTDPSFLLITYIGIISKKCLIESEHLHLVSEVILIIRQSTSASYREILPSLPSCFCPTLQNVEGAKWNNNGALKHNVVRISVLPLLRVLLQGILHICVKASCGVLRGPLPLLTREIIYRLLRGEQGARLRHLALLGGYSPSIARAIERLRQDYDQPLRIEQLARELGMSVSVFHHHFKAVTAMSPLQFQKRLREAALQSAG